MLERSHDTHHHINMIFHALHLVNKRSINLTSLGSRESLTNYSYSLQAAGPILDDEEAETIIQNSTEVAMLIIVATIGMIGNFGIIIVILVLSQLRRASNAFLFHQCMLDFLKSAYCLPFAQTMVSQEPMEFCSMLGGSYIVFVTTSAFNMLAIVMNEAYQFADLTLGIKDSRNYCCVIFGIFIIWFSSIIMNLGVTFIPGNPRFDRETGHCIFIYGITHNYVLHLLWIVLITLAQCLTTTYLRKLYFDIKRSSYYRMTTLIRATMSIDTSVRTPSQRRQSEDKEKHHIKYVTRITRKKLYLLILFTCLFTAFWYPLFLMSAADPHFLGSPETYKALTMFAWSNPTVTPFIIFFFIKTAFCCREDDHMTSLLDGSLEQDADQNRPNDSNSRARQPESQPSVPPQTAQDLPQTLQDLPQTLQDTDTGIYSDFYTRASGTSLEEAHLNDNGMKTAKNRRGKSVSLWI